MGNNRMDNLMLRGNIIRSGITISDISKGTNIPYSTVRDWLSGDTDMPRRTRDKAARLAWFLGVSLDELAGGTILMSLKDYPSPCKVTRLDVDGEVFPIYFELRRPRKTPVVDCGASKNA